MQAKKYKIEINESILDWTHGFGQIIEEYYVPDLGMTVNSQFIFLSNDERVTEPFAWIELDSETADDLTALKPLIEVVKSLEKRIKTNLNLTRDEPPDLGE